WAGKAILEIRRDETLDMGEVVPDRALEQVAPELDHGRRCEEIVEKGNSRRSERTEDRVAIRSWSERSVRNFRSIANVNRGIVTLAEKLDLPRRKRKSFIRRLPRRRLIVSRERFEKISATGALGEVAKLLRVMLELEPRRAHERTCGEATVVFAAAQLVGAGE